VGVAVGVDRNNVKHVYGRYVSALVPNVVPDALRSLYLEERKTEDIDYSLILGHDEEVDEILASPEKLFDHIQKDMKQEREANLVRGDKPSTISVDVAFCLDCTGSMSAWLGAAKSQILFIAKEIVPRIKKDYPEMDIELHFSVIEYRDYGDRDQIRAYPTDGSFTKDINAFSAHIQTLVARGGDDGPEDRAGPVQGQGSIRTYYEVGGEAYLQVGHRRHVLPREEITHCQDRAAYAVGVQIREQGPQGGRQEADVY